MSIQANPSVQSGALITATGTKTALNMTTNTLVKAVKGRVANLSVLVAGSGAGTIHDSATIVGAATANEVAVIPATAGVFIIDMPVSNGIVVKPGTGQTVVISYL